MLKKLRGFRHRCAKVRNFSFLACASLIGCSICVFSGIKFGIELGAYAPPQPNTIYDGSFGLEFLWYPAIALAILPVSWIVVEIYRRCRPKQNPHACTHCGYDLRATPDLCPECGNVPAG